MKIKSIAFLLISILLGCGKVPTTEPNQPVLHFIGDFETGNLSGFHFLVSDSSINTVIVSSPVRKGKYALKNTLRPDVYVNNGYRSELAIYNCAKYKTEVYYGFSFFVDSTYSNQEYNIICQWQDLPNYDQGESWSPTPKLHGSSPPISLTYVDETIQIKMNENPSSDKQTFIVGSPQKIDKGKWYDVVAHIFWSDDNTGYIELWLNGLLITPFNGKDNKYYKSNLFSRAGNHFKFGQYRGKNKTSKSNIIYFDEVKIGSSYNEVAP